MSGRVGKKTSEIQALDDFPKICIIAEVTQACAKRQREHGTKILSKEVSCMNKREFASVITFITLACRAHELRSS